MVADIEAEIRYTQTMIGRDAFSARVMQAMQEVPRDAFVPDGMKHLAFENGPLPIGHGQTISQPYIVALMTDLLAPQPGQRILEIGTGSGYQTAILSRLCAAVYTMDIVPELVHAAAQRLARLGFANVEARSGNGYRGWAAHAPYSGIIVTAAAPRIPGALIEQLEPGGRLVIPVGLRYMPQDLLLVSKDDTGETHTRMILRVAFVPLLDREPVED